jgi:predicted metal-dependent hydrolase
MTTKNVKNLAKALLTIHGLHDWDIVMNNNKLSVGMCCSDTKRIFYSKRFLEIEKAEIIDTILHEIAHALVGNEHDHNDIWREKAISIGCKGTEVYIIN